MIDLSRESDCYSEFAACYSPVKPVRWEVFIGDTKIGEVCEASACDGGRQWDAG